MCIGMNLQNLWRQGRDETKEDYLTWKHAGKKTRTLHILHVQLV